MSAKEKQVDGLPNDVQIIREILFGDQAKQFQARIERLEQAIAALKEENNQLRQALEAEASTRQQETQTGGSQLSEVEKQLHSKIQQLDDQANRRIEEESQRQNDAREAARKSLEARLERLQADTADQFHHRDETHTLECRKQDELSTALIAALEAFRKQ
jgi:hypothetical protein